MNPLACNYAVARFLPYPETGEFVNVGVLLACPQTGFFGYLIETRRRARVYDFFPELHREIYATGLQSFKDQLRYFNAQVGVPPQDAEPLLVPLDKNAAHLAFAALTRPREALFRFGPPSTVLTDDPAAKLNALFDHYVRRQFAQDKVFQEEVMNLRLEKMLADHHLAHFYETAVRLGNEDYHVTVPFVHRNPYTHTPNRAIKPLDLNKRGPTEILEHGDHWIARVKRLRDIDAAPARMLFTVHFPHDDLGKRVDAAKRVIGGLQEEGTEVIRYEEEAAILAFAKVEMLSA